MADEKNDGGAREEVKGSEKSKTKHALCVGVYTLHASEEVTFILVGVRQGDSEKEEEEK